MIILSSFYFFFFKVSAQTEAVTNSVGQNLVNGRLLFANTNFSQGGTTGSIFIAKPERQPITQPTGTLIISGRVTLNTLLLSGAIVKLSGTTNAVITTDADGNYQFPVSRRAEIIGFRHLFSELI